MNPSKTLKTAAFALVIASATAGPLSASEDTVTVSVPNPGTVVRSSYAALKRILPYVFTIGYYTRIEPVIESRITVRPTESKAVVTEQPETNVVVTEQPKTNKRLQTGVKKIVDAFIGIFLIDRLKEDAKALDKKLNEFFGKIERSVALAE